MGEELYSTVNSIILDLERVKRAVKELEEKFKELENDNNE